MLRFESSPQPAPQQVSVDTFEIVAHTYGLEFDLPGPAGGWVYLETPNGGRYRAFVPPVESSSPYCPCGMAGCSDAGRSA